MSNHLSIFVGGKKHDLNQNTYLAQGGEAVVHQKHGTAFKIYHDPAKMIPAGKIKELSLVTLPNVLGPKELIQDARGKDVGFTMPFKSDTEFLSRIFVSAFRISEGITPAMIKELVKHFQLSMKAIHSLGDYLVVDNNEYNLLVSKGYDEVYFIDVDSWKTPHFPATALMDSVRDRSLKVDSQGRVLPGQFSIKSDWFSFAVTATQIYLGCHPYKGRHPDYKPKDWAQMMDKNISVFDPKCKLPPNTQDLSVIPPAHRKWLEGVLQKGDRSEPPQPDQIVTNVTTPQVIFGTETFTIDPVRTYEGRVLAIRFIQGVCYAQTTVGLYAEQKKLNSLSVKEAGIKYDFCPVAGDNEPLSLTYSNAVKELEIVGPSFRETVSADNFFVANNRIYTVQNERIVEFAGIKMGAKTILTRQVVGAVLSNKVMGDGVITQSIFGRTWMVVSAKEGTSGLFAVPELDGYRIIETRRAKNVIIGVGEKNGRTDRFVLVFDYHTHAYNIRIEEDTASLAANFVVLDKGVVVAQNDDKAELFFNNLDGVSKYKVVDKFPLTKGQQLVVCGNDVYFFHEKGLFKIALHK